MLNKTPTTYKFKIKKIDESFSLPGIRQTFITASMSGWVSERYENGKFVGSIFEEDYSEILARTLRWAGLS